MVTIIVAVATHAEGYSTLGGLVPGLIFHIAAMVAGAVLTGLGFKVRRTAGRPVASSNTDSLL
jgi:tetrahydromethanopterin S-methyltransferase subunit C